jgi:hypothetical protein
LLSHQQERLVEIQEIQMDLISAARGRRTGRDLNNLRAAIDEMARTSQNKSGIVQVYFYDGAIANSMIIGNADSSTEGAIQVEVSYLTQQLAIAKF